MKKFYSFRGSLYFLATLEDQISVPRMNIISMNLLIKVHIIIFSLFPFFILFSYWFSSLSSFFSSHSFLYSYLLYSLIFPFPTTTYFQVCSWFCLNSLWVLLSSSFGFFSEIRADISEQWFSCSFLGFPGTFRPHLM